MLAFNKKIMIGSKSEASRIYFRKIISIKVKQYTRNKCKVVYSLLKNTISEILGQIGAEIEKTRR